MRPGSIGVDAPADDGAEHGDRDVGSPLEPADLEPVAELLPGRRHELLLALHHHADAEPGGGPHRRVEVQVAQPCGRQRRRRARQAAPPASFRTPAVSPPAPWLRFSRSRSSRRKTGSTGSGVWSDGASSGPCELAHAEVGQAERLDADAQRAAPDARVEPAAGEAAGEALEVAADAGRELPHVVDGELHLRLGTRPRRCELVLVGLGDGESEPRLAAGLERGDEAREVRASRARDGAGRAAGTGSGSAPMRGSRRRARRRRPARPARAPTPTTPRGRAARPPASTAPAAARRASGARSRRRGAAAPRGRATAAAARSCRRPRA